MNEPSWPEVITEEDPLNVALEIVTPEPINQFCKNCAGVNPMVEQSVTDSCPKHGLKVKQARIRIP